jgi:5-methylthioadenosine/S-adenosylhomocysteine deaminase
VFEIKIKGINMPLSKIFDTLVHNGTIVTVNPEFDIIKNGWVGILDGRIKAIQAQDSNADLPFANIRIDADGGIIMPGLVNTHTHLPMTLFRGLADDLPFMEWLHEHIFPAEAKWIAPETVKTGALLACAEMLLSGTTTCCDGYFLEENVAKAVQRSGMRAVLGQGVIDFPAPGVPDPSDNVAYAQTYVDTLQNMTALITPSIFCHSPYTCSAETLIKAKAAARKADVLFQVHVAETRGEAAQIPNGPHESPVTYLDKLGILDSKTILVHAIWIDKVDIEIIAARDAKISHNPESNMKLAAGVAPVPALLDAGVCVGLGTDGCASNTNLDLFGEMDTAAKLHKVMGHDPTLLDARQMVRMATIEGAKAIGLSHQIGSLEPGKRADLIVLNTRRPHLTPLYHPESHLVYAACGNDVSHVFVDGNLVVKNRKILTFDVEQVMAKIVSQYQSGIAKL